MAANAESRQVDPFRHRVAVFKFLAERPLIDRLISRREKVSRLNISVLDEVYELSLRIMS
jgi:hypothetical protein